MQGVCDPLGVISATALVCESCADLLIRDATKQGDGNGTV